LVKRFKTVGLQNHQADLLIDRSIYSRNRRRC
jgi:hypothetical protein